MTDSTEDLKPLLLEVLKTVQTIKVDHDKRFDQMDRRFDQMDGRLDQMDGRLNQMDGRLDQMNGRLNQMDGRLTEVVSEQKQIKELVGAIRLREIGRLDGRIDQLAQDVALSHRASA